MSTSQFQPALHWPSFFKAMAVDLIGLILVGVYLAQLEQFDPAPDYAFLLTLLALLPGFLVGCVPLSLALLASLRVAHRFPRAKWLTSSLLRGFFSVFLGVIFLGASRHYVASFAQIALLALLASLGSALLYPILWRKAAQAEKLNREPPKIQLALIGLVVAEFSILSLACIFVIQGFMGDLSEFIRDYLWAVVVWAMTLLPIVRLQLNHHASGKPIRMLPILLLQLVRGCFAVFVFWLPTLSRGLDWPPVFLLALLVGSGAGVLVGFLPATLLVHLRNPPFRSQQIPNRRPSLSWPAAWTAMGAEMLFGVVIAIVLAFANPEPFAESSFLDHWVMRGVLIFIPVSCAIRWGFVHQAGGWRELGLVHFFAIYLGTSLMYPLLWGATVSFEDGLPLLAISMLSALAGGGAYILDCKLRADELLPS
jgi:hypothetical protein